MPVDLADDASGLLPGRGLLRVAEPVDPGRERDPAGVPVRRDAPELARLARVLQADLLSVAEALAPTSAPVPLPIRVTGLGSTQVTRADLGWLSGDPGPWNVDLRLEIHGASYDISAIPGQPVTPSPTGTDKTSGEVSATKTVDGLGITVSASTSNSASAPTAAQVLAHVTSLGVSPSGWTTSVLVK